MHKIRSAMGKRDALYQLEGAIEFDEGYFEKATSEKVKLKRGRGSQRQLNVAVMAESTPLEDLETKTKNSQCRYFKMIVMNDHNAIYCSDKNMLYSIIDIGLFKSHLNLVKGYSRKH